MILRIIDILRTFVLFYLSAKRPRSSGDLELTDSRFTMIILFTIVYRRLRGKRV